jgi:GNAT superfamily N-acetyltransferase
MSATANFGEYSLSSSIADQQIDRIHAYLSRSYWAANIPLELLQRAIEHSLCFGIFHRGKQVAFARVVTDRATFAYLCDVFVLEEHRGHGVGKWLIRSVMEHPDLQGLRRFMLATRDAHTLYTQFGFATPAKPESLMEIVKHDLYRANQKS